MVICGNSAHEKVTFRRPGEHGLKGSQKRRPSPMFPSPVFPRVLCGKEFLRCTPRAQGENQQKHYHQRPHSPTIIAIVVDQRPVLSQRRLRLYLTFTLASASCGPCEVRLREKYLWRYK